MEPAGPERPPPTTDDGEASAVWVDGSSGLSYVVKIDSSSSTSSEDLPHSNQHSMSLERLLLGDAWEAMFEEMFPEEERAEPPWTERQSAKKSCPFIGNPFPPVSTLVDIYTPQFHNYKRGNLALRDLRAFPGVPNVEHIDIVRVWKGLTSDQAREMVFWEDLFRIALTDILRDRLRYCRKLYFKSLLVSSNRRAIQTAQRFYSISANLADLVLKIYQFFRKQPNNYRWLASTGRLLENLNEFVLLHDCFVQEDDDPDELAMGLGFCDPSMYMGGAPLRNHQIMRLFEYAISVGWRPDRISFDSFEEPLVEGNEFTLTPRYCALSRGSEPLQNNRYRTIKFSTNSTWLHWDNVVGCFRGVVPFVSDAQERELHPDVTIFEIAGEDNEESSYALHFLVKCTFTQHFDSKAHFEQTIRATVALNVKKRPQTTSMSPGKAAPNPKLKGLNPEDHINSADDEYSEGRNEIPEIPDIFDSISEALARLDSPSPAVPDDQGIEGCADQGSVKVDRISERFERLGLPSPAIIDDQTIDQECVGQDSKEADRISNPGQPYEALDPKERSESYTCNIVQVDESHCSMLPALLPLPSFATLFPESKEYPKLQEPRNNVHRKVIFPGPESSSRGLSWPRFGQLGSCPSSNSSSCDVNYSPDASEGSEGSPSVNVNSNTINNLPSGTDHCHAMLYGLQTPPLSETDRGAASSRLDTGLENEGGEQIHRLLIRRARLAEFTQMLKERFSQQQQTLSSDDEILNESSAGEGDDDDDDDDECSEVAETHASASRWTPYPSPKL